MDPDNPPETADEVIAATAHQVTEAVRCKYDNVVVAIRENPLLSVAIAAGIGVLLALVARSNRARGGSDAP